MTRMILMLCLFFCVNSLQAVIAVIHGSQSIPADERGFAKSLAVHIERWYGGYGVACRVSDDRSLDSTLRDTKLAVLVYVSQPDSAQLSCLRAYLDRGGKLIVLYSASSGLAQLMGMQNLGYQGHRTDGRWSSMRFSGSSIPGVPPLVKQCSSDLIAVAPVAGHSRVVAWWHDRDGKRTDAAWLASSSGYWMTHVLLADGDADAKARLLLALAAAFDRSLWGSAAKTVMMDAARVGEAGGASGLDRVAARISDPSRRDRARKVAADLIARENEVKTLIQKQSDFKVFEGANDYRARIRELYGLIQSPRRGEIRAVWDHSGMGLYPGNWSLTCELLKHAGITDIYVNVAGSGFAYYDSKVLPRSALLLDYGDQLKACVDAARPHGLRVHAWLLCFSTERAAPTQIEAFRNKGWLLTPPGGSASRWLDPGVPEVRSYLVRAVQEMAVQYDISGVHLDFVRYPDFNTSLGADSRGRFERETGTKVASWPADVKPGGTLHSRFAGWRAQHVSLFVNASRRALRRDAPNKLLTAAVFGKYPSCVAAVGQDWVSWIDINLVDYVTPMNYTSDLASFSTWVADQTGTRDRRLKVVPGIGVTANESRLNAAQVIDQIQVVRNNDCPGFALFDLDTTLLQEILPVLRLGMTAP